VWLGTQACLSVFMGRITQSTCACKHESHAHVSSWMLHHRQHRRDGKPGTGSLSTKQPSQPDQNKQTGILHLQLPMHLLLLLLRPAAAACCCCCCCLCPVLFPFAGHSAGLNPGITLVERSALYALLFAVSAGGTAVLSHSVRFMLPAQTAAAAARVGCGCCCDAVVLWIQLSFLLSMYRAVIGQRRLTTVLGFRIGVVELLDQGVWRSVVVIVSCLIRLYIFPPRGAQ
jgi:hypothetical protein